MKHKVLIKKIGQDRFDFFSSYDDAEDGAMDRVEGFASPPAKSQAFDDAEHQLTRSNVVAVLILKEE